MSLIFVQNTLTPNPVECTTKRQINAFYELVIVPMAEYVEIDLDLYEMDIAMSGKVSIDENFDSQFQKVYELTLQACEQNADLAEIKDELIQHFETDERFKKS